MPDSNTQIEESFRYCEVISKREAKNFYYSFLVLPPEKRKAMCAIYSFMRYCDDAVDEPVDIEAKKQAIKKSRDEFDQLLSGGMPENPMMPALGKTITQYQIPPHYFYELMDGMEMDINCTRYETFANLYQYCYRAASVVGLVTLHVLGFQDKEALHYGEYCGVALQLTNIIRDIPEDLSRGRIYLPQEDLQKFGVNEAILKQGRVEGPLLELLKYQAIRAYDYYHKAEPLFPLVDKKSQPCLVAMVQIYRTLLDEIVNRNYDVYSKRVRLSSWRKLSIGIKAWCKY